MRFYSKSKIDKFWKLKSNKTPTCWKKWLLVANWQFADHTLRCLYFWRNCLLSGICIKYCPGKIRARLLKDLWRFPVILLRKSLKIKFFSWFIIFKKDSIFFIHFGRIFLKLFLLFFPKTSNNRPNKGMDKYITFFLV